MSKKIVVFIDTQNDFMHKDGALYVDGAHYLIADMQEYAKNLNPNEVELALFTFDTHGPEYEGSPESEMFPKHCEKNTWGWENVIDINSVPVKSYTLTKGVFNMWEENNVMITATDFDANNYAPDAGGGPKPRDMFMQLCKNHEITDVEIVGVASDYCVKWAVDGFLKNGFNVTVKRSLTKGITKSIDEVAKEDDYLGVKLTVID